MYNVYIIYTCIHPHNIFEYERVLRRHVKIITAFVVSDKIDLKRIRPRNIKVYLFRNPEFKPPT